MVAALGPVIMWGLSCVAGPAAVTDICRIMLLLGIRLFEQGAQAGAHSSVRRTFRVHEFWTELSGSNPRVPNPRFKGRS